ncbi:MAG TPA: hypothetical protein VHZ03_06150 [Trebonia sp.]|nr:hypothetical protein [Trebonia sp.]
MHERQPVERDRLAATAGRQLLEVTANLPFVTEVPTGHGHKYTAEYVEPVRGHAPESAR